MTDDKKPERHEVAQAIQVKFRCYEDLKSKIDAAAQRNQVSLSAEICNRLEQTFRKDQQSLLEGAFFGGAANTTLLRGIAAILTFGSNSGEWMEHPGRRIALRMAIHQFLDGVMPIPDVENWNGVPGLQAPDEVLGMTDRLSSVVDLLLTHNDGKAPSKTENS